METKVGIQTFSIERCLNLSGIRRTDCRDDVGVCQTALEHVGVFKILLQQRMIKHISGQSGPVLYGRNIINALETKVMDRDYGGCAAHRRVSKKRPQIDRDQTGLPVVAVDNIRDPVQIIERCQRRFPEEAVFRNILDQIGIRIAPVEEFIIIDEIVDNAVHLHFHDADVKRSPVSTKIHGERTAILHLLLVFIRNAFVFRQDHFYIAVEFRQLAGKRIHYIAQTAGLDERIAFRTDEGDTSAWLGKRLGDRGRLFNDFFSRCVCCLFRLLFNCFFDRCFDRFFGRLFNCFLNRLRFFNNFLDRFFRFLFDNFCNRLLHRLFDSFFNRFFRRFFDNFLNRFFCCLFGNYLNRLFHCLFDNFLNRFFHCLCSGCFHRFFCFLFNRFFDHFRFCSGLNSLLCFFRGFTAFLCSVLLCRH